MEYTKDWYNHNEKVIEVRCKWEGTILILNVDQELKSWLEKIEKGLDVNMVVAESLTDILALPAFLAIINPTGIKSKKWKEHFQFVMEYLDPKDCSYLFVEDPKPKIPDTLEEMIVEYRQPLSYYELKKQIILRLNWVKRFLANAL